MLWTAGFGGAVIYVEQFVSYAGGDLSEKTFGLGLLAVAVIVH